jgi:hypothetical protein
MNIDDNGHCRSSLQNDNETFSELSRMSTNQVQFEQERRRHEKEKDNTIIFRCYLRK